MTGLPEQPDRRSTDPLVRLEEIDERIAQMHRDELAWERARADRLESELRAARFVIGALRVSASAAFVDAVDMAATEELISLPDWLRMAPDTCEACGHRHAGPARAGICIGCPCDQGAQA